MAARPPTAEELTACPCLRLRQVTRRVTQIYDQALAPAGVTSSQFSLLSYLQMLRSPSIGELADRMMVDPTTLTRTLRPLEAAGLIVIASDRNDRRRRTVASTDAGRAAFRKAVPLWRRAHAALGNRLGASGLATLQTALDLPLRRLESDAGQTILKRRA